MFAQLGLSMVVPILAFIGLGYLAQRYLSLPGWTMLLFILIGVAAGINGVIRLLKMELKRMKRSDLPNNHTEKKERD